MNKPSTEAQATIRAASAQFVAYGLRGLLFREIGHQRAGITKNHGPPRNKRRAKMARTSRRRNRQG